MVHPAMTSDVIGVGRRLSAILSARKLKTTIIARRVAIRLGVPEPTIRSLMSRLCNAANPRSASKPPASVAIATLQAIAEALQVPLLDLVGPGPSPVDGIIHWDVLADAKRGPFFAAMLSEHCRVADEFLAWSEFLPCSLETHDFMVAHHKSKHTIDAEALPLGEQADFVLKASEVFNAVGDARRAAFLDERRTWRFVCLVFRDDLLKIAERRDEYEQVDAGSCASCFVHLRTLLENPKLRLTLVVCENRLRSRVRELDSLATVDERFAAWRNHRGDFFTTDAPAQVRRKMAVLRELRATGIEDGTKVIAVLREFETLARFCAASPPLSAAFGP